MTYEQYCNHVNDRLEWLTIEYDIDHFTVDTDYHDHFSWHSCEICQRKLAGERYLVVGVSRKNGAIDTYEFEACSDCVLYVEYGHIDDYIEQ